MQFVKKSWIFGFAQLDSLGMLNVDFRVKQLRFSHAHKIFNDRCPLYLSEHFVQTSNGHSWLHVYRNDPKFSDRHVWANSVAPDQTAPQIRVLLGAV